MRIHTFVVPLCAAVTAACMGCSAAKHQPACATPAALPTMTALYTAMPITLDGKLDEKVWQSAETYKMHLPADRAVNGPLQEGAEVRLAWDDEYLYVGVRFSDSDIVAEGREDQMRHYELGDVCELFLKPAEQSWYWELYATPLGKKSTFFFPSQGRLGLPSSFHDYTSGLQVAAQCDGTVNDWRDRDHGWTAEMAMPIKDLTARGETFGPGAAWRILVARYNYSYYLTGSGPELSSTSHLSKTNYHLLAEYAVLKLAK